MEWRKNLYQYEAQPPEQVWNLVAEDLKDEAPVALRDRLYEMETPPPAVVWENLSGELYGSPAAPVIWYRQPWKVAAAAAVVAVLAGAAYLNRENVGPEMASTSVIKPVSIPQQQPKAAPVQETEPRVAETEAPAPVGTTGVSTSKEVIRPKKTRPVGDRNYIYFTSVNGENKRLSYKLEKLLPAIRNNKRVGMVDEWTSTLERSSFVPSGDNFFDIVEMVRLVEDQQR